jgi:hypothetical protein
MALRSRDCTGISSDISIDLDDTATSVTPVEAGDGRTAFLKASPICLPEPSGHFDESSARSPDSLGTLDGHLPMDILANDLSYDGSLSPLPPILESGSGSKGNFNLLTVSVAVPCLDSQNLDLSDPLCNSGPSWLTPEIPSAVHSKGGQPSGTERTSVQTARTVCIRVDFPKPSKR